MNSDNIVDNRILYLIQDKHSAHFPNHKWMPNCGIRHILKWNEINEIKQMYDSFTQ